MTRVDQSEMRMTCQERGNGKQMATSMVQSLKTLVTLPVAIVTLLLGSQSANAVWDMYPSFTGEAGLNDNIRLTPENEDNAGTGAVEGQLTARNVSENHSVQVIAALRHTEYSGTDLNGGTTGQATISANRRTERINYGFVGIYQNQPLQRYGVIDAQSGELIGSIQSYILNADKIDDTDPDLDIGFVEAQIRREFIHVSPNIGYEVSTRGKVELSGRFRSNSYDSTGNQFGLEDSKGYGASAQYQHQLSERSTLLATVSTDYFRPDQSPDSDRYSLTVGLNRKLTERTQFQVEVGLGRSETETDTEPGSDDTVLVYRASLNHRIERGQLRLRASRDNHPTGHGNVVATDQLSADMRYALTERWEAQVSGRYISRDSNLDSATSFNDADYLNFETRIGYALTPNWKIGGAYRFSWVDRQINPDSAQGNAVFAFVSYSPQRPF